jgi:hypothetical protein
MVPPAFVNPALPGLEKKSKSINTEFESNGSVPKAFSIGLPGRVLTKRIVVSAGLR